VGTQGELRGSGPESAGALTPLPAAEVLNIAMLNTRRRARRWRAAVTFFPPVHNLPLQPARYITRRRPRPAGVVPGGLPRPRAPAYALQRSDHAMIHPARPLRSQIAHFQPAPTADATTEKPHIEFPRLIYRSASKRNSGRFPSRFIGEFSCRFPGTVGAGEGRSVRRARCANRWWSSAAWSVIVRLPGVLPRPAGARPGPARRTVRAGRQRGGWSVPSPIRARARRSRGRGLPSTRAS
jgi:hypothetical protein